MISLTSTHVLVSLVLLSSVAFGLYEENASDVLAKDSPDDDIHFPLSQNNRIYGGKLAVGTFPYTVSLRLLVRSGDLTRIGTGSILTNRFVVTAARCLIPSIPNLERYRVISGAGVSHELNVGKEHIFHKWIQHEDYHVNRSTFINNIALIEVFPKIAFFNLAAPIELHRGFINGGDRAFTVGWGKTNVSLILINHINYPLIYPCIL